MYYKREFNAPAVWGSDVVLLHFEAIDYNATVYVNGKEVGSHVGGYTEFELDVTAAVQIGAANTVVVSVRDFVGAAKSDFVPDVGGGCAPGGNAFTCGQVRGKQADFCWDNATCGGAPYVPQGGDIYYRSTSGIWGPVWLEHVPPVAYISDVNSQVDAINYGADGAAASARLLVQVNSTIVLPASPSGLLQATVTLWDHEKAVATASLPMKGGKFMQTDHTNSSADHTFVAHWGWVPLSLTGDVKLWSPDSPFLYNMTVSIADSAGVAIDTVHSYAGIRTVRKGVDAEGTPRLLLNEQPTFQIGPLDQGVSSIGCARFVCFVCARLFVRVARLVLSCAFGATPPAARLLTEPCSPVPPPIRRHPLPSLPPHPPLYLW